MTSVPHEFLKKANKSLEVAKQINQLGTPEFAISRAYYAMFYIATALLETENLSFSKHSGVIAAFGKYFSKTGKVPPQYHRYLIEAEKLRTVTDYSINIEITPEESEAVIEQAEEMLNFARNYLG
jgi:uncharacterized protein (UPF0332 family)